MSQFYLSCFTARTGEARAIEELAETQGAEGRNLRESFAAGGLRHYRKADRNPCEMATDVVRECVQRYALAVDSIDTVIYSTNSFWSDTLVDRFSIARFMSETGLRRANPVGVHLGQCANFHWGLLNARALIASGAASRILIVNTDCVPDSISRIITGGLSVASDAASCCLLSAERPDVEDAYEVRDLALMSDSELLNADRPSTNLLQDYGMLIRKLCGRLHKRGDTPAGEIRFALFNNYVQQVVQLFARFMEYKPGMVLTETLPDIAHALASDCVINLMHLQENTSDLQPGDKIALIGTAPASIGGAVLQRA